MMPLFALMVDGVTTCVQVTSLSHGIVSVRVIHPDEIVDTVIFLVLSCFSYCDLLYGLAWLLVYTTVAIFFEMITNVQHRPTGNRINRFSDWLGYLDVPMMHPIGIDSRCLILLLY